MATPGKLTAFPGGASSFGVPILPTAWAGGKVFWVCNRTNEPTGDGSSPTYPLSSVFGAGGAIAKAAGVGSAFGGPQGCTIMVLPGHAESITAATLIATVGSASVKDLNIVGLGSGTNRPLFTWTAAASKLTLDVAGTWFRNVQFNFATTAATVVTAAVLVSAANCGFEDVYVVPALSATVYATTAIDIGTGGNGFTARRLWVTGPTAATNPTDVFKVSAAVTDLYMEECNITAAVAANAGVVNVAAAALNLEIRNSVFTNLKATSSVAMTGTAGATGSLSNVRLVVQATGAALTALTTPGNLALFNVKEASIGKYGIDAGTTST